MMGNNENEVSFCGSSPVSYEYRQSGHSRNHQQYVHPVKKIKTGQTTITGHLDNPWFRAVVSLYTIINEKSRQSVYRH